MKYRCVPATYYLFDKDDNVLYDYRIEKLFSDTMYSVLSNCKKISIKNKYFNTLEEAHSYIENELLD